jgi:hypothetical protein
MGLFNFFKKSSDPFEEELSNERKWQAKAAKPLNNKLEAFAEEIVSAFSNYSGNNMASWDETEKVIRPIGKKINNYNTQLLVLHRAIIIGKQKGVEVYIREMEYFWDGIGGWRK